MSAGRHLYDTDKYIQKIDLEVRDKYAKTTFSIVITSVDISTVCVPDPHPVAVAQPLHRIILADPQSNLKVHKRENFLGSDIEMCTFSQLVIQKC